GVYRLGHSGHVASSEGDSEGAFEGAFGLASGTRGILRKFPKEVPSEASKGAFGRALGRLRKGLSVGFGNTCHTTEGSERGLSGWHVPKGFSKGMLGWAALVVGLEIDGSDLIGSSDHLKRSE